jgi:hypothetical protein
MTMAAWIKPTSLVAGDVAIISRETGTIQFRLGLNSGKPRMLLRNSSGTFLTLTDPAAALTLSGTYFVVGTWAGPGAAALYVDAVSVATGTLSGSMSTLTTPFGVGAYATGGTGNFRGTIDEVALWDRVLTGDEIELLYQIGSGTWVAPEEPDPDPVPGWLADEDRTDGLVSIAVTYGAPDAAQLPQPLVTEVELAGQVAGDCPSVGERFRLTLSDAAATALDLTAAEAALFTGEVTDPRIDPVRGIHTITGAGRLGRANRRTLSASDWPSEDDGDRTSRILDAGEIESGTIDPGTVTLAAPGEDDTAGALLDTVTASSGGAVVEQPDGVVDYHDADHRRGGAVVMTLDPGQILNTITWEQHVDDVLNEMEVEWTGGVVKVRDPASIATYNGVYPGRRSTALTSASDAHSLGQLVVARRSIPRWQLPNLEIDLMHTLVDDTSRGDLLRLRHGDRILITDVPGPHPYSGDVEFLVEGWHQSVTRPAQGAPWRWRMILSVSDPVLSGVSIRWVDFETGYAWEDLPAGLSWLDLALIDDPDDL